MVQLLYSIHKPASFHLAAEEILLRGQGEYLLLYINPQSVVIGSNQAWQHEVNSGFCHQNEIQICRRSSGGGAVYHDKGNVNYCFVHDKEDEPLDGSFLLPVMESLLKLGMATFQGERKDLWVKYADQDYKISGTASEIKVKRVLHHGTLLFNTDLEKLEKALKSEVRLQRPPSTASVPSPVMNLRSYLELNDKAVYSTLQFLEKLVLEFEYKYGKNGEILENYLSDNMLLERVIQLQQAKYEDPDWTYRK